MNRQEIAAELRKLADEIEAAEGYMPDVSVALYTGMTTMPGAEADLIERRVVETAAAFGCGHISEDDSPYLREISARRAGPIPLRVWGMVPGFEFAS
jgi:hypothetical protein